MCCDSLELSYYSSAVGQMDICAHCGDEKAHVDPQLKLRFKNVVKMCDECKKKRLRAYCCTSIWQTLIGLTVTLFDGDVLSVIDISMLT